MPRKTLLKFLVEDWRIYFDINACQKLFDELRSFVVLAFCLMKRLI